MSRHKTAARVALLAVGVATLAAVVYIMVRRIGLNPELDFGAGAYYYADIPEYEKVLDWDTYQARLPYWVYVALFLAWGAFMYWLWKRLDQHFNSSVTMNKLNHPAILVVDMLNDFVTGSLACDRGQAIVPATAALLNAAREKGVPVIFCNDCHLPGIDKELKLWGDHAIKGTPGAEVIPELGLCDKDYVVPKRRYSGFFQTDLDILLKELGVQTVIITGLHTHMCCRHTSADAYMLGYDVVVAKEATNAFTEEDYLGGLAYLKTCYGADAYTNEELIAAF